MKNIPLIVLLFIAGFAFGQGKTVSSIDFVKVKDGKWAEAIFFYQNNWKVYREVALSRGYINSYAVMKSVPDSLRNFDLILVTEYADSTQLSLAEERFQKIIKEVNPSGPKLLNSYKPADFRINLFLKRTTTLFSSGDR